MSSRGIKRSAGVCSTVPETPRKRRILGLSTPATTPTKTPSKSSPGKTGTSPYSPAKTVLRRSAEAEIVGRTKELCIINDFVTSQDASLYICGAPGTGKSSTVSHYTTSELQRLPDASVRKVVSINCASFKEPLEIYKRIMDDLQVPGTTRTHFSLFLQKTTQKVLLILDEVDYLKSDVKILSSLFELAQASPHLKIIGIANALSLTEGKALSLLRQHGIEPQVLGFKPYTAKQITAILTSRISSITLPTGCPCLVQPRALDLIGCKIAKAGGDIRQALDLLRRAIEMVESEYRGALSSLSSNTAMRPLSPVSLPHVSRAAAALLGSGSSSDRIAALSIHEKAVLCTMIVCKTSTSQSTFDAYVKLCLRNKLLTPFPLSEFNTVLSGLVDKGLVTTNTSSSSPSKRTKNREERISLDVREIDVLQAISDVDILKRFFDSA